MSEENVDIPPSGGEEEESGEPDITAMAVEAPPGAQTANVYLCERGHRTLTLWGEPSETCNARPTRHGGPCGLPIYHMTALPERVQKALNPIKASKKKAGK